MKKIIFTLLFPIILTSCAVQVKPVALKRRISEDLPLNTVLKNEIGDRLITVGEEDYQEALKIIECPEFKIPFALQNYEYPNKKGEILPLSSMTDQWLLYYNKDDNKTGTGTVFYYGVAVNKMDNSIIEPFVSQVGYSIFPMKKVEGFVTKPDIFIDSDCKNCFKQEFIFNGKVGTNLKFVYREFINDMARPAYNQDLQYDLDESNIVGFKGLRLEIIKATNTSVEYKILSSFNKI
jgi:hypothetical protein